MRLLRLTAIAIVALVPLVGASAETAFRQAQGGQRGAPPSGGQPGQPGQRGGGGGRGRGAIQNMTMTSPSWPDGTAIPRKYTQAGDDISPPLVWSGAPEGTASFVLVVHDLDAAL